MLPQKYRKHQIDEALQYLVSGSFVIFRKHLGAYALYAGSDFDIDQAVSAALPDTNSFDLKKIRTVAGLQPILAKRHYHETGAIRWFNLDIVPVSRLQEALAESVKLDGAVGRFLLAIPTAWRNTATGAKTYARICRFRPPQTARLVYHPPPGSSSILHAISQRSRRSTTIDPELRGDAVARREVAARLADIRNRLEQELGRLVERAIWHCPSRKPEPLGIAGLNHLASDLADERFAEGPQLFNELVNRDEPSSNAVKAQKDLMRRMIDGDGKPRLGIEGYPAEAGLCESILLPSGLYRQDVHGRWHFAIPAANDDPARIAPLFGAALKRLRNRAERSSSSLANLRRMAATAVWRKIRPDANLCRCHVSRAPQRTRRLPPRRISTTHNRAGHRATCQRSRPNPIQAHGNRGHRRADSPRPCHTGSRPKARQTRATPSTSPGR